MGYAEHKTEYSDSTGNGEAARRRVGSSRPVDLVHLARYTLGNRSLECEVLGLFRTQSTLYMERLRQARSGKAWHDAAHTIKGSARGIGAWALVESAERAEQMNGVPRCPASEAAVRDLESRVDEVNAYISSILAEA
ncbi:MAG: Hpt domain-containing protein [Hyphomicrobiales bacterium]